MMISGWGRYPQQDCVVHRPRSESEVRELVGNGPLIARGNGRGYGDCALNQANTVEMLRFNRLLGFDPSTGQVVAEAGILLEEVIDCFLPRGWFPWVTPGTKFVTLGGMVAADVHGKNHHCDGSFGRFVDWIDVLCADGEVRRCDRRNHAELFACTIGGMGLTGIILRLAFRLRPVESAWIRQATLPARNLDAAMHAFEEHASASYSVAWVDCLAEGASLGRSVIMLGEHAARWELPQHRRDTPFRTPRRKRIRVPLDAPHRLINRLTVKAFNAAYYRVHVSDRGTRLVDWDSYFYPLDALADWNRLYGKPGLLQFQCVLPPAAARDGLGELLRTISASGQGSFLAVLKRLGAAPGGALAFPMEGYTLALDFPVSQHSLSLMERIDRIVLDHGGRFYLAKDSRMSAQTLRAADSRVPEFFARRRELGGGVFHSSQSKRLDL